MKTGKDEKEKVVPSTQEDLETVKSKAEKVPSREIPAGTSKIEDAGKTGSGIKSQGNKENSFGRNSYSRVSRREGYRDICSRRKESCERVEKNGASNGYSRNPAKSWYNENVSREISRSSEEAGRNLYWGEVCKVIPEEDWNEERFWYEFTVRSKRTFICIYSFFINSPPEYVGRWCLSQNKETHVSFLR